MLGTRKLQLETTEDIASFLAGVISSMVKHTRGSCIAFGPRVLVNYFAEMNGIYDMSVKPTELTIIGWALERLAEAGYLEVIKGSRRKKLYRLCKTSPLWGRDRDAIFETVAPLLAE